MSALDAARRAMMVGYHGEHWTDGYEAGREGLGLSACDYRPGSDEQKLWAKGWKEGHVVTFGYTGPKNGDLMPGIDKPIEDPCAILDLEKDPKAKKVWKPDVVDPIAAILDGEPEKPEPVRGPTDWPWPVATTMTFTGGTLSLGNISYGITGASAQVYNDYVVMSDNGVLVPFATGRTFTWTGSGVLSIDVANLTDITDD